MWIHKSAKSFDRRWKILINLSQLYEEIRLLINHLLFFLSNIPSDMNFLHYAGTQYHMSIKLVKSYKPCLIHVGKFHVSL